MSFVANQSSPLQKTGMFSRSLVPNSNSVAGGLVVVFVSSTDRDQIDIPTSASALLNGRAYAGVVDAAQQTVDTTKDLTVLVQTDGIQPCQLKANTACTSGQTAAYDPADAGLVVPYTSLKQVPIGKFIDERATSASIQWVGVQLNPAASDGMAEGLVLYMSPEAGTASSTAENAYANAAYTVPASFSRVGDVYEYEAVIDVSNQNGSDTLIVRLKFGGTTIVGLVNNYAPNPGETVIVRGRIGIDDIGATASVNLWGQMSYGADETGAGTSTAALVHGFALATLDTTAALSFALTAQWSASSASNLADLKSGYIRLSRKSA